MYQAEKQEQKKDGAGSSKDAIQAFITFNSALKTKRNNNNNNNNKITKIYVPVCLQ